MIAGALPSVSVVVVNFNGLRHLEDCFGSLLALDYRKDRLELICVDNASSDGSVEFLRRTFPSVRIVEAGRNAGFASGCNLGAGAASGDFVAFLNNDMRVDPGWVRALLAPMDAEGGVVCTSGRILSWDGSEVDFVRGALTFYGMGSHVGPGVPAEAPPAGSEPLLFASGGSMMVDRGVFLDAGGFDDDFFAFFEDVDFGWRLWLYGYRTAPAPEAVSYHRVHASFGELPKVRLQRLYERNALVTLIKNSSEPNLGRLLAPSVMLAVRRGMIDLGAAEPLEEVDEKAEVARLGLAPFVAIDEVVGELPQIVRKRAEIQKRRKRSDAEIFRHFARPFQPVSRVDAYLQAQATLVRLFGIDEMFPEREAAMVLVVAECEPEWREQWERRAERWALSLAGSFEVSHTGKVAGERSGLRVFDCEGDETALERLAGYHEIVFAHAGRLSQGKLLSGPLIVADLAGVDPEEGNRIAAAIEAADAFIVEREEEAARWTEVLKAHERQDALVAVVPDEGGAALHDLCRHPDRLWAARGRRRLDRYTYEVEVLMDNWERDVRGAREILARRDKELEVRDEQIAHWRSEYESAAREVERVRNHFVMRTYLRLRKLIPIRRGGAGDA